MRYRASFSFESDTQPVRTYRGEIDAPGLPTAASQTIREAKKAYPGARWRSIVLVLEKLDESDESDAQPSTED